MKWVILLVLVGLASGLRHPPPVAPLPFDSAARAVGEVARALGGPGRGLLDPYPPLSKPVLAALRHLPPGIREAVLQLGLSTTLGTSRQDLARFELDSFFGEFLARYPRRRYPAVVLGAPGGGVAHLAALLGAPFLPVCGLLGLSHSIQPDDLEAYLATGMEAAQLLAPDGRFEVLVHYDPIHDRDLVKHAALVRVRLLTLPQVYRKFINQHLTPGGTVVLTDCSFSWPQVPLSPGVWLQVGGLGGISPQEFLATYSPPGEPEWRRESEWGCPPPFSTAAQQLAREGGFRFLHIPASHPHDYSHLAYRAYVAAGAQEGTLLIDCFTSLDVKFCLQSGIAPLHLAFNTRDALEFAREFLSGFRPERAYLLLHPSLSPPPDLVPLSEWREALGPLVGELELLVDERFWPADPYAAFAAAQALRELGEAYPLGAPLSLPPEELRALVEQAL